MDLTAERVRELLDYDPETGIFTWRGRPVREELRRTDNTWNSRFAGQRAGSPMSHGYREIRILGRHYTEHRVAWLWMTGAWPLAEIDHANAQRSDNRWANLREATRSQNSQNHPVHRHSKTGIKGVGFDDRNPNCKWTAEIRLDGRVYWLGSFETPAAAAAAYARASMRLHGEFSRLRS